MNNQCLYSFASWRSYDFSQIKAHQSLSLNFSAHPGLLSASMSLRLRSFGQTNPDLREFLSNKRKSNSEEKAYILLSQCGRTGC